MLEAKFRVWDRWTQEMRYSKDHEVFLAQNTVIFYFGNPRPCKFSVNRDSSRFIYLPSLGFIDSANQTVYLDDVYRLKCSGIYYIPQHASFELLAHIEEDFQEGATVLGNKWENPELMGKLKGVSQQCEMGRLEDHEERLEQLEIAVNRLDSFD